MPAIEVFAPAKINLSLHVTGQRGDGYHLLDSLVMFADVGDRITVAPAEQTSMRVIGPMAEGVPDDRQNLCWKAADAFGETVAITLEKHLPAAAGIGGGSSDAAAVLAAMERLFARSAPINPLTLGADVPVCRVGRAVRMTGIGERLFPLSLEPLQAVLVNPGVSVSTPEVFRRLPGKNNAAMTSPPERGGPETVLDWLAGQRNDLEPPARVTQPVIGVVLDALWNLQGTRIARMSGSGATCFAVFDGEDSAHAAARALQSAHPDWWVRACALQ